MIHIYDSSFGKVKMIYENVPKISWIKMQQNNQGCLLFQTLHQILFHFQI